MERRDYWDALVRGWWLIAIFGLVGLGVALLLPKGTESTYYQSTSSFGAAPPPPQGTSNLIGGGIAPNQITYYAGTDQVMEGTSKLSGLNEPPAVIRSQISLLGPPSNNNQDAASSGQDGVVDVKVSAPTAAEALTLNKSFDDSMELELAGVAKQSLSGAELQTEQTLARVASEEATNSFPLGVTPQALAVQVSKLQDSLATLVTEQPNTGFEILQQPTTASVYAITTGKTVNNSKLRIAAGLGIGLLLGALAAVGAWLLDRRLKTAKRAQAAFGYPVVAEIPDVTTDAIEPYRMLWLSVFRQPLPLPPAEHGERLYDGESAMLEPGYGLASTTGPPK